MKLAFGKHKGKELRDVPSEYLMWLIENSDVQDSKYGEKNRLLVEGCHQALNAKSDGGRSNKKPSYSPPSNDQPLTMNYVLADMRELIDKIYQAAERARDTLDVFETNFGSKKDPI